MVYLTTAQSFVGFCRDAAIIWISHACGSKVLLHQFGANYRNFYESQFCGTKLAIRRTLRCAERIFVEGRPVKEQFCFLADWTRTVTAIPNGLPRSIDRNRPKEYPADGEPFVVLYLSNMIESKGYRTVLDALRMLIEERCVAVEGIFVGEFYSAADDVLYNDPNAARQDFMSELRREGLKDRIRYAVSESGEALEDTFEGAHVLILPTNYVNEGQPIVVLDAMARGLVVISTAHRLIPTMVVDGETGFLVEYSKPEQIVERIESLIATPQLFSEMSERAIARFHRLFTKEAFLESLTAEMRTALIPTQEITEVDVAP